LKNKINDTLSAEIILIDNSSYQSLSLYVTIESIKKQHLFFKLRINFVIFRFGIFQMPKRDIVIYDDYDSY
jgi:hypothetical protein